VNAGVRSGITVDLNGGVGDRRIRGPHLGDRGLLAIDHDGVAAENAELSPHRFGNSRDAPAGVSFSAARTDNVTPSDSDELIPVPFGPVVLRIVPSDAAACTLNPRRCRLLRGGAVGRSRLQRVFQQPVDSAPESLGRRRCRNPQSIADLLRRCLSRDVEIARIAGCDERLVLFGVSPNGGSSLDDSRVSRSSLNVPPRSVQNIRYSASASCPETALGPTSRRRSRSRPAAWFRVRRICGRWGAADRVT